MSALVAILQNHPGYAGVILRLKPFRRLDFSEKNKDLVTLDLSETTVFSDYVFNKLLSANTYAGIGGYGEDRIIYRHRKHFGGESNTARSIHLGTDIWVSAGEPVFAPLDATVHSFAFNNHYGDYGPTIILRHQLDGLAFFTLYGHLSLDSLEELYEGKPVRAGEKIAEIGSYPVNGDWPPHLHFQIISDIGEYRGDFPGVASQLDSEYYLSLCPDPNLILRVQQNGNSNPQS